MVVQLWWVRLPSGEEFGPITTSSLHRLIEKGMITAADQIAEDPDKIFRPISETDFFALVGKIPQFARTPSVQEQSDALQKSITKTIPDSVAKDFTRTEKSSQFGTAKISVLKTKASKESREKTFAKNTQSSTGSNTIELRPKSAKKSKMDIVVKLVLGGVIFGSVVYLILPQTPTFTEESIHLIAPKENSRQFNDAQIEEIYSKSKAAFEADNFGGYLFAMNQLVTSAEGITRRSDSLFLLCLTYFELWPYSFRDSEDLSAVTKLTQMTAKTDPLGPHGGSCRAIQQILNGRWVEANGILDSLLTENPGFAPLYYLKARVLEIQENYRTAASYAQKTEQLWPDWTKPFIKEVYYMFRQGQTSDASNRLREIIKAKPKHSGARVLLGIIEYKNFRHADSAIELLKTSLSSDRLENSFAAEGAFALAAAYLEKQDKNSALEWAKKAYVWDPTIVGLKDFLVQQGGEKILEGITKNDREHLALGDQYFDSSNYLSAQAHYKTAFENNPKNATAAFKAGKALWKLNQGLESIEWFKKAIQVDSSKPEFYVALADVYSARYDFFAASAILQKAQKQSPKHYDVYRGFANLAYRRNDFNGAISSAKKALSLYDTDMQSILLLSKSYRGANQSREAYAEAARAIELEKTNAEAQALYGSLLADVQGSEVAIQYLQNLVNTFPKIPDYGIALAKLHLKENRVEQALEAVRQVVSVNPQNKAALLVQGEALFKLKKIEDSLASYLAAAALDPSDGEPLFLAGQVYLESNKPAPAVAQFERVLLVSPNFPKVRMAIGRAALLVGDRDRALKEVAAEKRINPGIADPYLLAGDINMELKQYPKAAGEYQAALKLRPQGAEVYLRLAKAYRLSNQYDVALSMLRTAETRESGNSEIAKEFGAVYELKGDNIGAVKFYNRYLQILPNAPDRTAIVDRINQLGGVVE